MYKLISFLLISNIVCHTSCSQTINIQKLDNFFDSLSEHDLALGSIAVSKNGVVEYQKAIDYTQINKGKKSLANIYSKYRIGSVTKMFTAVIIFQLIEEGKLSLNDKLGKYIFNLPKAKDITIEDMLYHRSGIPNYSDTPDYNNWKYKVQTKTELIEIIAKLKWKLQPAKKAEYSNSNFLLLSLIIEDISKKSYQKVLNERVLSKIKLEKTYFENVADTSLIGNKSYKYFNSHWTPQQEDIAFNHLGAGAIISTPTDITKFIDALFSNKLISSNSLRKMTTIIDGYGMGIFPFKFGSYIGFGHEGRLNEFYTTLIYFQKEKLSIAYCTNGMIYPRDDIIETVVKLCMDEPCVLPQFNSKKLKEGSLNQYLGKYNSEFMPITVECKQSNGKLIVETQGKEFETFLINENYFINYKFGYFFEFFPEKEELMIKETDNIYYLKKLKQ